MHKTLFSFLTSCCFALCMAQEKATEAPAASTKIPLTLEKAQAFALRDNPSLKVTKERIETAIARMKIARSSYFPSLNFNQSYTRVRDVATRTSSTSFSSKDSWETGFALNWTLFDGFQRRYENLVAQSEHRTAIEQNFDARRELIQSVSSAFYMALLSKDSMNIAKEDADFNKILYEDAKKRQEGGIAKTSEVLNFILQVKNAEVDYITAENNWRISIVGLGALLNITEDSIWEHYELVPPSPEASVFAPDFQKLYDYSIQHRPDLKEMDEKIFVAEEEIRAARGAFLPSLNFFGNLEWGRYSSLRYNNSLDRDANFGVALSWNLFDGGAKMAKLAQAQSDLTIALRERENLLISIDSNLRDKILTLQSSRDQLELQENILKTAKEIRDLVRQEYDGGTTTITRLNEAQTDVTKAASSRASAYIQVLNSIAQIKAITGENYIEAVEAKEDEKLNPESVK